MSHLASLPSIEIHNLCFANERRRRAIQSRLYYRGGKSVVEATLTQHERPPASRPAPRPPFSRGRETAVRQRHNLRACGSYEERRKQNGRTDCGRARVPVDRASDLPIFKLDIFLHKELLGSYVVTRLVFPHPEPQP